MGVHANGAWRGSGGPSQHIHQIRQNRAVREQTVEQWLARLASPAPAPGGGGAAAMNAAAGAALVAMVCNLTIGRPRYAEHEKTMTEVLAAADALREQALSLDEEDAAAYGRVLEAYRLPKDTDETQRSRSAAIEAAMVDASGVQLRLAALAAGVIGLAGRILDGANVNVLSEAAVAAASARAGLTAAALNVEANMAAVHDAGRQASLAAALAEHTAAEQTADEIVQTVRQRMRGDGA
jgi:methenyltetrahydrofolate cyclohydrolase